MQRKVAILILLVVLLSPVISSAAEVRGASGNTARRTVMPAAKSHNSLQGKTIVVDPGHGGSDPGAIGKSGLAEKDVTLAIGLELQKLLAERKARVVLTRSGDQEVHSKQATDRQELQARVNFSRKAQADMFVSIHIDAFADSSARGTTTYFLPKAAKDKQLAVQMQQSLVAQLGLLDRGARENELYVLKYATVPAVLVEVAFISNPTEELLLKRPEFIKQAAYGILSGITNYFHTMK